MLVRMSTRLALAACIAVMAATAGVAMAAPVGVTNAINRKVPLACQLMQSKIVVITNSTSGTISAGTRINFDALRRDGVHHFTGSFASGTMPPGASVQRPAVDALSCTAWYVAQPMMKLP
jgi:hypothetical protein